MRIDPDGHAQRTIAIRISLGGHNRELVGDRPQNRDLMVDDALVTDGEERLCPAAEATCPSAGKDGRGAHPSR